MSVMQGAFHSRVLHLFIVCPRHVMCEPSPLDPHYDVCCIYWAELGAKIQTKWRKIISILSLIRESWMIELFFLSPICLQLKSISGTINWNPGPHHNPQSQIYSKKKQRKQISLLFFVVSEKVLISKVMIVFFIKLQTEAFCIWNRGFWYILRRKYYSELGYLG